MKNISTILLCGVILLLSACEKDKDPFNFAPKVVTGKVTDIYRKGATLFGNIQIPDGTVIQKYGILLSKQQSLAESTEYLVTDNSAEFSFQVENLDYGTTYYYCTFASAGHSVVKSEIGSFTTLKDGYPLFKEISLTGKTGMSVSLAVDLLDDGGSEMPVSGFCWTEDVNSTPTINDNVQNFSFQNETLSGTITGLAPHTSYRICAYATNSMGTGYSESIIVTTENMYVPKLGDIVQDSSENLSVTISSEILDAGNGEVSRIGFCWSAENKLPDTNQKVVDLTEQLGSSKFSATIDGFSFSTAYYIRAFAVNEMGTGYSQVFTFQTVDPAAPTLEAIELKDSTDVSITVASKVLGVGTSQVKGIGFCWSTENQEPTINDASVDLTEQMDEATFSTVIDELKPGTTYYICAYAVNEEGVGYSETFVHQTRQLPVPVLSEVKVTDCTGSSITVNAQVLEDYSTEIEGLGFCWSTESQEPTINHRAVNLNDQIGSSTFGTTIHELAPNTTYYIRAYAINGQGVGYSETVTCKTLEDVLIQGTEGEAYVAEAGGLSKFVDDTNKYNITKLKVSGYLNGDDIRLLREMAGRDYSGNETEGKLVDLDMTDAVIMDGGYYFSGYTCKKHEIGEGFFSDTKLKNIILPVTIKSIGRFPFSGCHSLTSIIIPEGVTCIGQYAFSQCSSLTSIVLPSGIREISFGAFYECSSLTSIKIPDGVTTIGGSAFVRCSSLTDIKIPDGVTCIGESAFQQCSSLTSIVLPSGIREISFATFQQCSSLADIKIPDGVTSIGNDAFCACHSLSSINMPASLTYIGDQAFGECFPLTSINIPDGVTTIGDYAFRDCGSLTDVRLPKGISLISEGIFSRCYSLTGINIPAGVTKIGHEAFLRCSSLQKVTCNAITPPSLERNAVFYEIASSAVLIVPTNSIDSYRESDWATYFGTIEELE